MKAVLDWVVVTDETGIEKKTDAGIITPNAIKPESSYVGDVVDVGPGVRNQQGELIPVPCKNGDRVRFVTHSLFQVDHGGEKLIFFRAHNLMCTIEPEDLN